jgi:hypothetical protein
MAEETRIISNWIKCKCGAKSPVVRDWWKVQEWWREHGMGARCEMVELDGEMVRVEEIGGRGA